jgi:RNA polymerase sigma-70 factor, ECF subfamily
LDEVSHADSRRPPSSRLSAADDETLITQILDGDVEQFEMLVRRYASLVQGYLYANTGPGTDEEDLFQEVFIAAYSRLKGLRRRDRFGPWLMTIARNKLRDFRRKEHTLRRAVNTNTTVDVSTLGATESPVQEVESPMGKASFDQVQEIVRKAIGRMNETYRTVLYMRLIGQKTPQEIAWQLGLREGTVRVRLLRGLKRLRRALAREGITSKGAT